MFLEHCIALKLNFHLFNWNADYCVDVLSVVTCVYSFMKICLLRIIISKRNTKKHKTKVLKFYLLDLKKKKITRFALFFSLSIPSIFTIRFFKRNLNIFSFNECMSFNWKLFRLISIKICIK